jgi:hypothetical protein
MLGVQSNSYEDIMSKISITTSNFIIVKRFYFPSMKKILLEVIYRLLKSDKTSYMFGPKFLKVIIENIQVYGMSLEKFKRIIHFLLAEQFFKNDLFFVNVLFENFLTGEQNDMAEYSTQELTDMIKELKNNEVGTNLEQLLKTTKKYLGNPEDFTYTSDEMVDRICSFYRRKIKFFKAYEVLEAFCVSVNKEDNENHMSVFKHCFILNFLSCEKFSEKLQ